MPLPVPEWPQTEGPTSLVTNAVKSDQQHFQSMIHLCLVCRREYFSVYPESIPSKVLGSYLSKQEIKAKYFLGEKT
ncbi:hypothetical protein BGZ80_006997, partial [Entomortierella chlamydospora]